MLEGSDTADNTTISISRIEKRSNSKRPTKKLKSNQAKPHNPKRPDTTKFNLSKLVADVLGESAFAKNTIYTEQSHYTKIPYLNEPKDFLVHQNDFLDADMQLGYATGIIDLDNLDFDQFYNMSLWVAGEDGNVVIDRATGALFSQQIENSKQQKQFLIGYMSAIYQMVTAIAGKRGDGYGGFAFELSQRLNEMEDRAQFELSNAWFKHVSRYMEDVNPNQIVKTTASDDKITSDRHQSVFVNVRQSLDDGFLSTYVGDLNAPLLGNYNYTGADFSDQIGRSVSDKVALKQRTLTKVIEKFANDTIPKLFNAIGEASFYQLVFNKFYKHDRELLGLPVTASIDETEVFAITQTNFLTIIKSLGQATDLAKLAQQLPILNLSRARSHSLPEEYWNFQQKFSYKLDKNDQVVFNEFSQPIEIHYGIFNDLFLKLEQVLLTPLISEFTIERNRLLQTIKHDDYQISRDVLPPQINGDRVTIKTIADQTARYEIDELIDLYKKGRLDQQNKTVAKDLASFNRLVRIDPSLSQINQNDYLYLSTATKRVYFWIYQSSLTNQTIDLDKGIIDNAELGQVSLAESLNRQLIRTKQVVVGCAEDIDELINTANKLELAPTTLKRYQILAANLVRQTTQLVDNKAKKLNQANEKDILPLTQETDDLKNQAVNNLRTANQAFYNLIK